MPHFLNIAFVMHFSTNYQIISKNHKLPTRQKKCICASYSASKPLVKCTYLSVLVMPQIAPHFTTPTQPRGRRLLLLLQQLPINIRIRRQWLKFRSALSPLSSAATERQQRRRRHSCLGRIRAQNNLNPMRGPFLNPNPPPVILLLIFWRRGRRRRRRLVEIDKPPFFQKSEDFVESADVADQRLPDVGEG